MLTIAVDGPGGAVALIPPEELFTLAEDRPDVTGSGLGGMLDGFVDAGPARQLGRDHLLAAYSSRTVATFDTDVLHDYRARRPAMLFVENHWESYDAPRLELRQLTAPDGAGFLLLSGPEPDVLWERFSAAVLMQVETLGV